MLRGPMHEDGFFRCPECGSVETERRKRCMCGYRAVVKGDGAGSGLRRHLARWFGLRTCFWLLLIGAGMTFFGYQEGVLAWGAMSEPEITRLEDLEQGKRPAANYIRIERYVPRVAEGIYSAPKIQKDDPNPSIQYLLYPIVSSSEVDSRTVPILVLLETRRFAKASEVPQATAGADPIEGMLANSVRGFSVEEVNLIQQQFPHRNFHATLIVQEGRTPMPAWRYLLLFAGGLGMMLLALTAFIGGLGGKGADD